MNIYLIIIIILCSCSGITPNVTQTSNCAISFNEPKWGTVDTTHWTSYGISFRGIDKKRVMVYNDKKIYLDSTIILGEIGITSIMIPKKDIHFLYIVIDDNKCLINLDSSYNQIHIRYRDNKTTNIEFSNKAIYEW